MDIPEYEPHPLGDPRNLAWTAAVAKALWEMKGDGEVRQMEVCKGKVIKGVFVEQSDNDERTSTRIMIEMADGSVWELTGYYRREQVARLQGEEA